MQAPKEPGWELKGVEGFREGEGQRHHDSRFTDPQGSTPPRRAAPAGVWATEGWRGLRNPAVPALQEVGCAGLARRTLMPLPPTKPQQKDNSTRQTPGDRREVPASLLGGQGACGAGFRSCPTLPGLGEVGSSGPGGEAALLGPGHLEVWGA